MIIVRWHKTKNLESTPIRKPRNIEALLKKGYVVAKETESTDGKIHHIKIETFSPLTREQYYKRGGR